MSLVISKSPKALCTILAVNTDSLLCEFVHDPYIVMSCLSTFYNACTNMVYDFTPVWVRSCRLQLDESLKHLLQCLHVYGFTPV